jgi:minor extracellular serine protease Vpr
MLLRQTCCSSIVSLILACSAGAATPKVKRQYFPSKTAARHTVHSSSGAIVVNAASFLPGVSPGGLATVFGTNLTDVSGAIFANTNPFPTVLANVSVTVNGVAAAIFSVAYANGQDQISFQVPWETDTGPGAADVQVFDYDTEVAELQADSYTEDPGIFSYQKFGQLYAVALHSDDYTLVAPDNPAFRGEIIILYTTGLGPVDRFVRDGLGAPGNPPANTLDPFRVDVAGEDARIWFSGLAPGFVGLYQINLQLPDDLPAGDLTLGIFSDFANSQSVFLSVR